VSEIDLFTSAAHALLRAQHVHSGGNTSPTRQDRVSGKKIPLSGYSIMVLTSFLLTKHILTV